MADILDITAIIRSIRAKLNLTQEQLAERLGVSFATVNRWEGGLAKPQRAALEVIDALAREAGIDDEEAANSSAASVTRRRRRKTTTEPSTKPMEQMLCCARPSLGDGRR